MFFLELRAVHFVYFLRKYFKTRPRLRVNKLLLFLHFSVNEFLQQAQIFLCTVITEWRASP